MVFKNIELLHEKSWFVWRNRTMSSLFYREQARYQYITDKTMQLQAIEPSKSTTTSQTLQILVSKSVMVVIELIFFKTISEE